MNIYLVRNKEFGTYLHVQYGHFYNWVERQKALVYTDESAARRDGVFAFDFDDEAEKRFDIVRLVATAKVDKSQYPKTLDGVAIELGKTYYRFDRDGVCDVYVYELTVQFTRDGDIEYLKVREGANEVWVYSDDLYQSEQAAWKVWGETKWD